MCKLFSVMMFAFVIVLAILFTKYKPVYKVTIEECCLGYVQNKEEIQKAIEEYENKKEENIAFVDVQIEPQYELQFVQKAQGTNEEDILLSVKENSKITYQYYAITENEEEKSYVKTEEEAEKIVEELKENTDKDLELSIGVKQVFVEEPKQIEESGVILARLETENKELAEKEAEKILENKIEAVATVAKAEGVSGIDFKKPITGTITSRFGARSRGNHTGLDIAASSGTPIHPAAAGTVTYAGWKGSYGNLVIISHGGGIETYYAHCSKIYTKVGEKVTTDSVISAVGTTGNSTGNHLHLEIRVNGTPKNPQNFLY